MPSSAPNTATGASSEDSLPPQQASFLEPSGTFDNEVVSFRPQRQPRGSSSGQLRPQDRQGSSISIIPSGATTPANPFSTPIMEATNPFTPPESVISFSLGDAAAPGFLDAQQIMTAQNSLANSAVDLQQRTSIPPREAFSSPRPRPPTVLYASGNQGTRSRLARRKRPASTMLSGEIAKPWVGQKDKAARISYILTYSMLLLGIAAAGIRCYFGWKSVSVMGKLCPVLEDDFSGSDLDSSVWQREVDLGGFGWVSPSFFFFFVQPLMMRMSGMVNLK